MSYQLRSKAAKIDLLLEDAYGVPKTKKNVNVLDELILTLLSHNTNDINRDKGFAELRKQYPTWEKVLAAPRKKIENAIRIAGLAPAKSSYIKDTLNFIKKNCGKLNIDWICDKDPDWVEETFTQVKGIGVKTINVVLSFACGSDRFPVDTHINRICSRLGFVPEGSSPEKTYIAMSSIFPKGKAYSFHINIITHGRQTCKARNPLCDKCNLRRFCRYYRNSVKSAKSAVQ